MIDVYNYIFTQIYNGVRAEYPSATVSEGYPPVLDNFPAVLVNELENTTLEYSQDNELKEHHARITFDIDVFANDVQGKKAVATKMANLVDSLMQNLKFTRTMKSPTPNIDDSIYRIKLRYTAIVSEPKEVNGNMVYQIYRRQ